MRGVAREPSGGLTMSCLFATCFVKSLAFLDLYSHPVTEQYFHITPMLCLFARCRVKSLAILL